MDRLALQALLESILGSDHVYFQPPSNVTMIYPAIRYSFTKIDGKYANNHRYTGEWVYQIIYITKDPEPKSLVNQKLTALTYCKFDRSYVSDNLNHFVYSITI